MAALKSIQCGRCGSTWLAPIDLADADWMRIGSLRRQDRPIEAMKILRETIGLELGDAKAITLHFSREKSKCHRCSAPLDGQTATVCTKCRSFNYDY